MNKFTKAKADPANSTFRHVAYFAAGRKEVGYSKKEDFDEMEDKRRLFCTSMARLIPYYLGDNKRGVVWQLEIFRRVRTTGGGDPLIQEELIGRFDDVQAELFGAYGNDRLIKSFFAVLYETSDPKKALAIVKDPKQSEDLFAFNPAKETFEDLQQKAAHLRDLGYPLGDVERFFFAMRRRYFTPDGQPITTAPAAASLPTPPPPAKKRGGEAVPIGALMGAFNPA